MWSEESQSLHNYSFGAHLGPGHSPMALPGDVRSMASAATRGAVAVGHPNIEAVSAAFNGSPRFFPIVWAIARRVLEHISSCEIPSSRKQITAIRRIMALLSPQRHTFFCAGYFSQWIFSAEVPSHCRGCWEMTRASLRSLKQPLFPASFGGVEMTHHLLTSRYY